MENDLPKNLFIRRLAAENRVILLGGMAVIAHGRSRHTKDFDVWLEPFATEVIWAQRLNSVLVGFPEAYIWPWPSAEDWTDLRWQRK